MRVSIITVCLNSGSTIRECIESALSQTGIDLEHVFVDGGSSDNTMSVISEYACNSCIFTLRGSSIYEALNFGIARATGEVIGILHSDDRYTDAFVLKRVAERFVRNADLDVFFGSASFTKNVHACDLVRTVDSASFHIEQLAIGMMPAHTALFHRRRVIDQIGDYDTTYRSAADFKFCYKLFKQSSLSVELSSDVLVNMRIGGTSTAGFRSWIRTSAELTAILGEFGVTLGVVGHMRRLSIKCWNMFVFRLNTFMYTRLGFFK